jgi:hypothetical protein
LRKIGKHPLVFGLVIDGCEMTSQGYHFRFRVHKIGWCEQEINMSVCRIGEWPGQDFRAQRARQGNQDDNCSGLDVEDSFHSHFLNVVCSFNHQCGIQGEKVSIGWNNLVHEASHSRSEKNTKAADTGCQGLGTSTRRNTVFNLPYGEVTR